MVTEARIRRWRKQLLDAGVGSVTVAKAYRLLKAILNTAVDDGLIRRNPCRIKGAGQEKSPERPVLTLRQVFDLADTIDPRYRALILLAVFCSPRWGELAALRRGHIDSSAGVLRVEASVAELIDGSLVTGPPKSAAGRRLVSIPAAILPDVTTHLDRYSLPSNDSLVFTGPKNAPLRRSNFTRTWTQVTTTTGLTGFHFHDLRHTGNALAAATGASLRELMDRMGHSTTRAALIYQHGSVQRDRLIAAGISEQATAERGRSKSQSGTRVQSV
jgi:integrase